MRHLSVHSYAADDPERAALGIPPRPLNPEQVTVLVATLTESPDAELVAALRDRVPTGVDEAARIKAGFLAEVAAGGRSCPVLGPAEAVRMLGSMSGGFNVPPLVGLLDDPAMGGLAAEQLGATVLVHDHFADVAAKAERGNAAALATLRSWASMDWFRRRPPLADEIHLTVFKVEGEVNTDDLSPAPHAWSRADIPLHSLSLLENRLGPGTAPAAIAQLAGLGRPVAFVADVVGTGSSRKSAVNSLLWHIAEDVPHVPNQRRGGFVLAGRIAPIFFDTLIDSGGLGIECGPDGVARLATGDHIVIHPSRGVIRDAAGQTLAEFRLKDDQILDSVRAGGRIRLVLGRRLARRAAEALGLPADGTRAGAGSGSRPSAVHPAPFTLAQKIVGRACGLEGVDPETYCEPVVSTVGSQDTTGPMNRRELEDLACLSFGADLVLQTFCHTAAYPKPADVETQRTLPPFMADRGAVVLRPGDGIIHSWLNRMLLPDQVGTGSDSHTRFPLGISFPAGSGLVAFAAAAGVMPITMPESVLVRFTGRRRPGITCRDLVHAIPFEARRQGFGNPFVGRIIEIEGVDDLPIEEAFELTDSTAERSAAACTIRLSEETVGRHLQSSVETLRGLLEAGYQGRAALERRIASMEAWLRSPALLRADADARYARVVEIDMDAITEPLVACPNDPDDVRRLSEVAGRPVDEVFIGSCMTHLDHFRSAARILGGTGEAVPTRLWIAPPTSLVGEALRREGAYSVYGQAGARTEVPGCSLCMGNQARVEPGATVVSTSTRNFPGRMGRDAQVYLASAEVASLAAVHRRLPTVEEYLAAVGPPAAGT